MSFSLNFLECYTLGIVFKIFCWYCKADPQLSRFVVLTKGFWDQCYGWQSKLAETHFPDPVHSVTHFFLKYPCFPQFAALALVSIISFLMHHFSLIQPTPRHASGQVFLKCNYHHMASLFNTIPGSPKSPE